MSLADVRSAFVTKLGALTLTGSPTLAYENVEFRPPNAPWLRLTFHDTVISVGSLGRDGLSDFNGFIQVDVNVPQGSGDGAALAIVEELRLGFTPSVPLAYGATKVNVRGTELSNGRLVEGYYRRSLTIYWFTQLPR